MQLRDCYTVNAEEPMSQNMQNVLYWFFYWIGNHMESNVSATLK